MSRPPSAPESAARRSGRGFVFIAGAKAWFILTSYAVHFTLPRLLGSPESFGRFSTVMSAASLINNVLIATTVLTVSKLTSEKEAAAPQTLRRALGIQLGLGLGLAGALALAAEPIATVALRDVSLTPLLRVVSVVVLSYALYAALVGALNGRQRFLAQAGLDASFSTLRAGLILAGASVGVSFFGGRGELGALAGFATAAALILVIALAVVGTGSRGDDAPSLRRWLAFLLPLALYQGFLNGGLLSDVLVLKSTVASLAEGQGMAAAEAAERASAEVGFYSAAQKFAFVPYSLMLAMTFVVFPTISKATTAGDADLAKRYLSGALRLSTLLLTLVAFPLAGAADGVMRIAYPEEYLAGAPALRILVLGAAAFALFVITGAAHSGAGRPGLAARIAGLGFVSVVVLNVVAVRWVGLGPHTVSAAAAATSAGMGLSLIVSGALLYFRFGTFLAPVTAVRIAAASGAGYAAAAWTPHHTPVLAVIALAAGATAHLGVLVVTRELGAADLQRLRSVLPNRR